MEQGSFWERVKQLIKNQKYSEKRLADYLGVPIQTLWGWIHYDRIPDAVTACHIAEVLEVTVEYLVNGAADSKPNSTTELVKKLELQIEQLYDKIP